MDLDIEMGDAADGMQDLPQHDFPQGEDILQPDEPDEPGEVADDDDANKDVDDESKTVVPNKVYIRGVDTLHTDDIKAYVKVHFGGVDKVEWIDDSSANLVFGSDSTARDAIVALSSIEIADATALGDGESLLAKPFDGKPDVTLHVRFSTNGDKKQSGAALRSRYYLLHPEHDPEEKRRRQKDNRSKYRDRDRDYDHHRNGGRRRRDQEDEIETFEASMYDDAPTQPRERRSTSSEDGQKSYARENRGKELFAVRPPGRTRTQRDRSASPRRERKMDIDDNASAEGPASSSRNRTKARSIKDRLTEDNQPKELFPTKSSFGKGGQLDQLEDAIGSAQLKEDDMPKIVPLSAPTSSNNINIRGTAHQRSSGDDSGFSIKGAATNARELFPDRFGSSNIGKELIDITRSKRRQKAEDLFS